MAKKHKELRKLKKKQNILSALIGILCASIFGIAGGADKVNVSISIILIEIAVVCIIGALMLILLHDIKSREKSIKKYITAHNKTAAIKLNKVIDEPFLRLVK